MEDFQTAATVFWLSFFANQRGCPAKLRPAILTQLVPPEKNQFYRDPAYENEFEGIHDAIMKLWSKKLEEIAHRWLESPAGQYHKRESERHR